MIKLEQDELDSAIYVRTPPRSTAEEEDVKPHVSPRRDNERDVSPPARPRIAVHQDIKPSFTRLPLEAVVAVAESLVARGLNRTLANLNATCKVVNRDTLPVLWRTVIWSGKEGGKKETQKQKAGRWKAMMVNARGSRYIQFIVDRDTFLPNTTRDLPKLVKTAAACKAKTLKAYIARFNDTEPKNILNDDPKVMIHLLPPYQPLSEDFITLRLTLYQIHRKGEVVDDICYLFMVHSPDKQPRLPLPPSLESHSRVLPSMPYILENVYAMPGNDDFVDKDRQQLAGVLFDLLASISHLPDPSWNAFQGSFASWPIMDDSDCLGFIEFMWHFKPESAIIAAESTAKALGVLSGSMRPWIQLSYGIHDRFDDDDDRDIRKILDTILPFYLDRAPFRFHPALHGMGDVVVQHDTDDLLGGLKRVLPDPLAVPPEERDVVEYFIKRCPDGQLFKEVGADLAVTHDEYLVFYEQYPIEAAL